jgi:hypothetical protein
MGSQFGLHPSHSVTPCKFKMLEKSLITVLGHYPYTECEDTGSNDAVTLVAIFRCRTKDGC